MRRSVPALIAIAVSLALTGAPALAQTPPPVSPSPAAPPEKIDPGPVRPENPAPPSGSTAPDSTAPSPAAQGSDPLNVAANVSVVRISGTWDTADGKGVSRIVGVIDGRRQRFYVQWLTEPDGKVFETKELEDEDAAKLTFGDVRAEPGDTGVTMFLDTVPDKDGLRDTWVLIVGSPGDIRFGPSTN